MRYLFVIIFLTLLLKLPAFAQGTIIPADSASSGIPDSSLVKLNDSAFIEKKPNSVYDIHWVTNCIKSGWKPTDTLLIGTGLEPCDTAHPFIMPVSGKFWRGCSHYHSGWDVGCDYGTPVKAGLSGKVRFANYSSGYGKLVIVRHYSGMEMYYAHLSKILVSPDEWVEAGDTVGLVGATGRARGNHLHMEFRVRDRALDISDYYVQNDTIINLWKIFDTSKKPVLPQGEEYYTVVRGDNLSSIASRYDTTVSNLCSLNNISKSSILRIGQKIRIM